VEDVAKFLEIPIEERPKIGNRVWISEEVGWGIESDRDITAHSIVAEYAGVFLFVSVFEKA